MRTNNLPFPQDSSGIPAAAATRPPVHSVPGDGSLRITWVAGPPRLILAGDIDLTTHAALIASLALAKAADGAGQVHVDMAGVSFCDVAGLRIILRGGDGQRPASAPAVLHNLPPHLGKLLRLLNRDEAPDLVNDAAGQPGTSTSHPDQMARPPSDGSAHTPVSALNEPGTSPPAAGAGQGCFPGQEVQPVPVPAVPRSRRGARSLRRRADA